MEEGRVRCFIAIDFPREIINEIERAQGEIEKKKIFRGKFTEGENLHLTLKFLGEIGSGTISGVRRRLREIGENFERFGAELGELGIFSQKFIRIIWIQILGGKILELQKEIDKVLARDDLFKPEERFMSHLTIARVKGVNDRRIFFKKLKKVSVKKLKFEVPAFYLMKSELKTEGPVYSVVEKFNFQEGV